MSIRSVLSGLDKKRVIHGSTALMQSCDGYISLMSENFCFYSFPICVLSIFLVESFLGLVRLGPWTVEFSLRFIILIAVSLCFQYGFLVFSLSKGMILEPCKTGLTPPHIYLLYDSRSCSCHCFFSLILSQNLIFRAFRSSSHMLKTGCFNF